MPIRLHPFVSTAALYATNLPLVLGWILALVGLLGPELSKNTSMAIASIGPLSGAAQPDGESGAWFGPFGESVFAPEREITRENQMLRKTHRIMLQNKRRTTRMLRRRSKPKL